MQKNPTKTKSDDPPVNYQLASATYYATVKGEYINISGVYNIDKLDDEWTLVPIISDQVGLSTATLDNKPAFMTTFRGGQDLSKFKNANTVSSGYYFLALKDKGIHTLKVNFSVLLDKNPSVNTKSFTYTLPNIPIVSLHCTVNEKNLEYDVPQATSIAAKNVEDGTKLFASFPPVTNIEVRWNPKSTIEIAPDKINKNLPPSINATSYSRIEVGKKTLKGQLTFEIDIRHAALDHFDFYVPDNVEIDSVTAGNNIELVDPSPQPVKNVLSIDTTSAVEGKLQLVINFRKTFNTPSFETEIPAITLANNMNAERETGYVAVVETTNIESSVIEADQTKSYQDIDSSELAGPLTGLKASIAFKYQKIKEKINEFPYDIKIKVVRHQDVAVYEATIKSTNINSVMNEDGQVFSKATFQVTNTRKQFLEITLPDNSEIWSVFVDSRSVKPAIKDANKNLYSIPLSKSSSSETGGKTFPVEIVYFTKNKLPLPIWTIGGFKLKALTPELDTNSINWTIYFPQKASFYPISLLSNLQEQKRTEPHKPGLFGNGLLNGFEGQTLSRSQISNYEQNIDAINEPCIAPPAPCQEEQAKEMKSVRDEYDKVPEAEPEMADTENPLEVVGGLERSKRELPRGSSGMIQSMVSGKDQVQSKQWDYKQQSYFRTKKIGKLPVYVNLPQVGNNYNFYQISFQKNDEPYIVTFYSHKKFLTYTLFALLIILGAVLVKPIKEKQFKSIPKFIIPAVVFVIVLYTLMGPSLIAWVILLAALFVIYLIGRWVFKFPPDLRNKIIFVVLTLIIIVLILFISLIIDGICFLGFLVLLIIALAVMLIVWAVKSEKIKWPFKKKPKKEPEVETETVTEADKEGQDNE